MLEEFLGIFSVDTHPGSEDLFVHIVGPPFYDSTPFHPLNEFFDFGGFQDDNMHDLDVVLQKLGLMDGSGYSIEEEKLLMGEIPVGCNKTFDVVVPDADG